MWRKLNGTGGAPGVADAVTYTLVWAGGKESSRWRTAGAEEALIDVGGSDEKCLAQCPSKSSRFEGCLGSPSVAAPNGSELWPRDTRPPTEPNTAIALPIAPI